MGNNKLKEMIDNADLEIEGIDQGLEQIDEQIVEVTEEITAVESGMCTPTRNSLYTYLNTTKKSQLQNDNPSATIALEVGPLFYILGESENNIKDWEFIKTEGGDPEVIYRMPGEQSGINWDNNATIVDYVNKYNFGADYLMRSPGSDKKTETAIGTPDIHFNSYTIYFGSPSYSGGNYTVFGSMINDQDENAIPVKWTLFSRASTYFTITVSPGLGEETAGYKLSYYIVSPAISGGDSGDFGGGAKNIASYGLKPKKDNLMTAKNLLMSNKAKLLQSKTSFASFA